MFTKKIDINGFPVGGKKTFIIADVGSNHMQDLSLAKESIDAASEAGVDAIKFQSIQLDELYLNPDKETREFIKKLAFPEDWHHILKEYCDDHGLVFFSSPTYLKAVDLLEEVDVLLYKLASAQIGTFPQVVEKVAKLNKPTIFSTGISNYDEIIQAVRIFKEYGNEKFIILHCNSIYPTPPDKVNLNLMKTYRQMFGNPVGFSDHTIGTHVSSAAVTLGASVIEKHFTLDRSFPAPDSNLFACDPQELRLLVKQIREIENATQGKDDRLSIQDEELNFKNSITYRMIAKKTIKKGDLLKTDHITYLRTNIGINATDEPQFLGRLIDRNIETGEPIKYDDVR